MGIDAQTECNIRYCLLRVDILQLLLAIQLLSSVKHLSLDLLGFYGQCADRIENIC